VFDEALLEEVKMTMKEKYSAKYDNNMIQRFINIYLLGRIQVKFPMNY